MTKQRLDIELPRRGMVETRSQAENWIRLGHVSVDGQVITKPGFFVRVDSHITLKAQQQYVSRAGLKLASVADALQLDFTDTVVLDVGSSTGGLPTMHFSMVRDASLRLMWVQISSTRAYVLTSESIYMKKLIYEMSGPVVRVTVMVGCISIAHQISL